jgi:hypothetical protein
MKKTEIVVLGVVVLYSARRDGEKSEGNFLSVLPVSERRKVPRPCPFVLKVRATCTS